jgi:hypothetical protein
MATNKQIKQFGFSQQNELVTLNPYTAPFSNRIAQVN